MQLFIRSDRTLSLQADAGSTVFALKQQLRVRQGIPEQEQRLIYAGRQLKDGETLHSCSIAKDATIHLVLRLLGGKGGFGALLRAGARSTVSQNTDACRDLSGRRMRHVNADKKLAEWASEAKERELEKVALQHIKAEEKAAARRARAEVDVDAIRTEQRETVKGVQEVVGGIAVSLRRGVKREATTSQAAQDGSKRAKLFADSVSDSESDEEDEDVLPVSDVPAGAAADVAGAAPSAAASQMRDADAATQPVSAVTAATHLVAAGEVADRQASVTSPKQALRETSVASDGSSTSAATASAAAGHVDSTAVTVIQQATAAAEALVVAAPSSAAAPGVSAEASLQPTAGAQLDWSQYSTAQALEVLGMDGLKALLQEAGLKCGGSLQERAVRLFLLKDTPLEQLDRKHFAKPSKGKR